MQLLSLHVAQSCYRATVLRMTSHSHGARQNSTYVTLYSLNRSLPNLVGLIKSATATQMSILVKFG